MFKEPFKQNLTKIAYAYMFMEPFKRTLTIIPYLHMLKVGTNHLTMVKVDIRWFDVNRLILS